MSEFVNVAVAERVAALRTARFFEERAARADIPAAIELLRRFGAGKPPLPGDEIDAPAREDAIVLANDGPRPLSPDRLTRDPACNDRIPAGRPDLR